MNWNPVRVIRDAYKNREWQPYAAAMAAAYVKAVLCAILAKPRAAITLAKCEEEAVPSSRAGQPQNALYGPITGRNAIFGTSLNGTSTLNFS
ncbi:hypothetical protein MN608_10812 [Microdochium nivale]|nr:hypothetical protein MN608_10812 [Microdochium nivale]